MKICLSGIIMIALFGLASSAQAQVAVIGNKSLGSAALDLTKVKNLYLLVSNEVNGSKVKLFDVQSDTPTKAKFYEALGKPASEAKKVWLKAKLTGNGTPPEAVGSEDDVLAKVESTPGAIGYISAEKAHSKVKTLLIIN
ncbi:MAG: hypothetical protein ACM3Q4_14480 [Acidobacteriota bacterium]